MFMLCYFCAIACAKNYMLSWEKWKFMDFEKASDTHIFYLFLQMFYKMLDPSSE
jgi:hypothetical protein